MKTGSRADTDPVRFRAFLSYRTKDSQPLARGLRQILDAAFGEGTTFAHFASIGPGQKWGPALHNGVSQADCLLALIGHDWIGRTNQYAAERRLDSQEDNVACEIALAIELDKPIVPILVDDMPDLRPDDLPPHLEGLAEWQSFRLRCGDQLLESAAKLIVQLRNRDWRREPVAPVAAPKARRTPDGTIDANCVQAEIDQARPGAQLELPCARVLGTLRIRKPIELIGGSGTVLEALQFELEDGAHVALRRARIQSTCHRQEAISIRGAGQVELHDCTIDAQHFDFGVAAYGGTVIAEKLRIFGPQKAGVSILGQVKWRSLGTERVGLRIENSAGHGIEVGKTAAGADVAMRCKIRGSRDIGIVAEAGTLRLHTGSQLIENRVGLDVAGKASATAWNTHVAESGETGIRVASDSRVEIKHCVVERNREDGIYHSGNRKPGQLIVNSIVRHNRRHGVWYDRARKPQIDVDRCFGNGIDVVAG